ALGRAAQGRGRGGGQRRPADHRRSARAVQPHARGVRRLAARSRPLRHARPPGHPHPALSRSLRAPAQILMAVRPRAAGARERIRSGTVRSSYAHKVRRAGGPVMGWIIAIIVGGVAGWLASIVMRRDASMGIFWNIIVGIVGALLGNAVLAPLLGFG